MHIFADIVINSDSDPKNYKKITFDQLNTFYNMSCQLCNPKIRNVVDKFYTLIS